MDNDTIALEEATNALIRLQVRYKKADLLDRIQMRPMIEEAVNDFAKMQVKLLKEGTIITQEDLDEIAAIKAELDAAADHQKLLAAGVRFLGFVAKFV